MGGARVIRRIVRYRVRPGEERAAVAAITTFVDDAARERHTETPHVQAFVERLYPLCVEPPAFRDLDLVAASVDRD